MQTPKFLQELILSPEYGYGTASMAKIHATTAWGMMGRSMKTKKVYQHVPFIKNVAVGLKK